jgi:hypothetical protein
MVLLLPTWTTGWAQAQDGGPARRPTATVPRVVRVDGQFTPADQGPVLPTEVVTLRLYDAESGGALIWEETQDVRVYDEGRYAVFLGGAVAEGLPLAVFDGAPRWLEVRFARDASGAARVPLTSVPYALKAADAETLGGWPASAFVRAAETPGGPGSGGTVAIAAAAADRTPVPVVNTGTANFLGKFANAIDLTSSVLYEGAGRIGVGTGAITPLDFLHVRFNDGSGASTGVAVQNLAATGYSGMLFYDHTGALGQFQGFNNSTKEYRINNIAPGGSINFMLGGTSRLRLRSDGDLDINATTSLRRQGALLLHTGGGADNVAAGATALPVALTSGANVALGELAARSLITGTGGNVVAGDGALFGSLDGTANVAIGRIALRDSGGSNNIAIGNQAGALRISGNYNIYVGADTGVEAISESSTIRLKTNPSGATFLGGIRNVTTGQANAVPVVVDSQNQLGTVNSSRRYKFDIHDMGDASSGVLRLRPVVFRYTRPYADGTTPIQYGLIAEEVSTVYPDAVVRNRSGEIETVQYHKIDALMLGEVQKQHRALLAQQADVEAQAARAAAHAAALDELRRETADLASAVAALERQVTATRR